MASAPLLEELRQFTLGEDQLQRIVDAAKACDPLFASRMLADAIIGGAVPSAEAFGAVVVACTNVRDLEGAEAWLLTMLSAGHSVYADLLEMVVATAMKDPPVRLHDQGAVPTRDDVGRWLRRLHAAHILPLTSQTAYDVVERLDTGFLGEEACEWAALAFFLVSQELQECGDEDVEDIAARNGVLILTDRVAPRVQRRRRCGAAPRF